MSIAGNQNFWITGSRFYFQRDPINSVIQPIIDLGRITNAAPAINTTQQTLYDGDGGVQRPVAVTTVRVDETYEFRASNMNQDNAALLFNANPPSNFVQASTVLTDIVHAAQVGRLLKLHDADGVPIYGLSAVTSVTAGATTYVEGTDWEVVSLERGIIRMIEGGAFATAGDVEITMTPRAIATGNRRLVLPHTGGCTANGTGLLFWGRCNNNEQTVREARFSISSTGGAFPDDNYADMGIRITALTDPTAPIPSGRLLYWLGQEPSLS